MVLCIKIEQIIDIIMMHRNQIFKKKTKFKVQNIDGDTDRKLQLELIYPT